MAPESRNRATALAAAAVLVSGVTGLAGCTAESPAPASALPEGVTVTLTQLRSDVAARQAQVQVRNGSGAPLTIGAVRLDDPRFEAPATRVVDRVSTLAPGASVDVRVQLSEVDCAEPDEGSATVTIDYSTDAGMSTGTAAAPEAFPFLAALHHGECAAARAADAATIAFGRFAPSTPGEPAALELTLAPGGGGELTVDDVRETNLLTFAGASRGSLALGAVVSPTGAAQTLTLPLVPSRCDPHAVQEDKRGTVFTLDVTIDDEPLSFTVAAGPDLKAQLLTWVTRWCGYG